MAIFVGGAGNSGQKRHLFSGSRIEDVFASRLKDMAALIAAIPEEQLSSIDLDALMEAIEQRFGIVFPTLRKSELTYDDKGEVMVDVRGHQDYMPLPGRASTVPGRRLALFVPFDGDGVVFKHDPPGMSGVKPLGEVEEQELVHFVDYPAAKMPDIKARGERFADEASRWANIAKGAVDEHNRNLVARARILFAERKARLDATKAALNASGVPQRKKDTSTKAIVEVIRRRPAPVLRSDTGPMILDALLAAEAYEHIVGVIRAAGRSMEQSPGTYEPLDEEARRQILRTNLNTHYHGQASAEAFNHKGKTDILVTHEGKSLFVCECKFWTGVKGFSDTIDQLFRYVTWRDTKLAIVMFVKEKGLTEIVEKGATTLRAHAQHHSVVSLTEESELRSTMTWPGDAKRIVTLHVFFVHTPVEKSDA